MAHEPQTDDNDFLELIEDREETAPEKSVEPWRILIVDDDDDVHRATDLALGDEIVLGRPLELAHARSAQEALSILPDLNDVAVAFIDVVMETPDAGLKLVRSLRERGFKELRAILRTGQPGYAPDREVVEHYEIDGYHTKSELTRNRLITVLTSAVRSYTQIQALSRSRSGLEMIVESSPELFRRTNLRLFSTGVLTQIAALLGVHAHGFVCIGPSEASGPEDTMVLTAAGRFEELVGKTLAQLDDPKTHAILQRTAGQACPVLDDGLIAIGIVGESGRRLNVVLEADGPIGTDDLTLLRIFSTNIAAGFENLSLVEKLDQLAYEDPTLRIPNLNAVLKILSMKINTTPSSSRIALLRVDGLQHIIATYGLVTTNTLLRHICEALAAALGSETTIGRIADATFALVGPRDSIDCPAIEALFANPFPIDGIQIAATATTSIIEMADLPAHPDEALRKAVTALIAVKQQQPGSTTYFDEEMQARHDRSHHLKEALHAAAATGAGIWVALQPKFDLATSVPVGAEALMRWTLDGETVPPGEFIPIAEANGLTKDLTMRLIAQIGRWHRDRGDKPAVPVAINLSMLDLNTPGFAADLDAMVRNEGMDPKLVEFEVTESIAMSNAPWAIQQVEALRDAGYRISLDDFGTGYSSLSHFRELPIHVVKIDRSFIQELDIVSARSSLAATVLAMAQSLDVDCIAEGIETEAQRQALVFLGCTVGQGFLLGRPTPIDEFDTVFGTSL